MSHGFPPPPNEDVRRARAVAVAALAAAVSLVILAVVSAFTDGGEDNERSSAQERPAQREQSRRPRPRPRRRGTVPASAPGAHRAPNEPVPVLVWHVVNTPQPDTSNPEDWTPPEEFREQVGWLADNGYHPVTAQQVWDAWRSGGLLPSKPVVLSFDVGYHSVYANALPVLRERRWPGVLFLQVSQTEADFPPEEVKALLAAGWELGSHGVDGTSLTSLGDSEAQSQAQESRNRLRQDYGRPVRFFSYPDGGFDQRVSSLVESAGYLGAFTDESGLSRPKDPPFVLSRLILRNGDGAEGVQRALEQASVGQ